MKPHWENKKTRYKFTTTLICATCASTRPRPKLTRPPPALCAVNSARGNGSDKCPQSSAEINADNGTSVTTSYPSVVPKQLALNPFPIPRFDPPDPVKLVGSTTNPKEQFQGRVESPLVNLCDDLRRLPKLGMPKLPTSPTSHRPRSDICETTPSSNDMLY